MKAFKSYDIVKPFGDTEKLPVGGYIIGILDAQEIAYSWGRVLEIKFDIFEGEYKNFFANQYKQSQFENKKYKGIYRMNVPKDDDSELDELTARKFKTDITALEESAPGFHWGWDEKQLIGKKVGAVFFEKEYDFNGRQGFFTTLHSFKNIESIRSGKFNIPEPKLLKKVPPQTNNQVGFVTIEEADDVPF